MRIPKVYTEFTTSRVLVQERLYGTKVSERSRIREANRAVPDRPVIRSVSAWLPAAGFGARSVG